MVVHIYAGAYQGVMSWWVIRIRGEIKGISLPDN